MFQVNVFSFWLCLFAVQHIIGSIDFDDLHDSLINRDGQKTSKENRNDMFCLHGNTPALPRTLLIKSGYISCHTVGCAGGSYPIAMTWSFLPISVCCKSLWSLALCPERVDQRNHKETRTVSLIPEHGEICSLKKPWTFLLYSENSWWSIFSVKVVISIKCLLKAMENFVLILLAVWSAGCLVCCAKGWLLSLSWIPCLNKKVFVPGEVIFTSPSRKNDTPIW